MAGFLFAVCCIVVLGLAVLWEKRASGLTWKQINDNQDKWMGDDSDKK